MKTSLVFTVLKLNCSMLLWLVSSCSEGPCVPTGRKWQIRSVQDREASLPPWYERIHSLFFAECYAVRLIMKLHAWFLFNRVTAMRQWATALYWSLFKDPISNATNTHICCLGALYYCFSQEETTDFAMSGKYLTLSNFCCSFITSRMKQV